MTGADWKAVDVADVATLLRKKLTPQEIAGALGVTAPHIHRIIRQEGLVYQKSKFAPR